MNIEVLYLEKPQSVIDIEKIEKEVIDFEKFFEYCFGYRLKSIQRNYAKRFFANFSFSVVAPTGTGKTILGLFLAFYNSFVKQNKSLLIFPTQLLVKQSYDIFNKYLPRIEEYIKRKIEEEEYLFFLSFENKNKKEEKISRINNCKLLSITNQFLSRRFDLIENKYDYIFVDDLDSISKGSKNTIRILKLLGFNQKIIDLAKQSSFEVSPELASEIKQVKDKIGVLVISSATLRKGINSILFRKLLNFDIGSSINFVRNIDDVFIGKKDIEKLKNILEQMGPGAIIFTTSQEEAQMLEKIIPNSKFITSKNIKKIDDLIDIYEEFIDEDLFTENENENNEEQSNNEDTETEEFIESINENINYLIGIASPYSILVRGLDLPYKIRYVVFWGIPKRKIDLKNLDNYRNLYPIQKLLSNIFFKRKMVSLERIKEFINNIEQPKIISSFVIKDNFLYSIDIKTYLQASGRCSRITPNGITKGVSFIFDDEIFLEPFSKNAYFNNFEVKQEIDIQKTKEEIDATRKKDISNNGFELDFKTYLMIVESPTKAKQIAQMFGTPGITKIGNVQAFEVLSPIGVLIIIPSLGHVTELAVDKDINIEGNNIYNVIINKNGEIKEVKTLYCSIKKCKNCNKTFASISSKCIYCSSSEIVSSLNNVISLKTLSYFVDGVLVATDPDSEGEKISFDLINLINPQNHSRIVFNEITKKAIIKALSNPIKIRRELVNAQLIRRIEDRWIGFALSKILQEEMEDYNISAGRVQSPVLHWITEKYKEYNDKKKFAIVEDFNIQFINSEIKGVAELEIKIIDEYWQKINILPFNTSDILIFANNVLKLNSQETMKILQKLFENGLITYHRTDSYYISDQGINIAKEIYNKKGFSFNYRTFGEPHAHEAIRITKPLEPEDIKIFYQDKLSPQDFRVYEMIFRRFLACFSGENKVKIAKYKFILRQEEKISELEQERIVEVDGLGFEIFPYLSYKGQKLEEGKHKVKVRNIKKPTTMLYSQADIIKMMKEKEIGRPSTYAFTIQKLLSRAYVIEKFNRLIPTKKGIKVDQILTEKYYSFVNEQRTKELLKKIDEVEQNIKEPINVIKELLEETQLFIHTP